MPAGCQPKDKLAARALQSARAAFTVAATLIAGCASIDSSGDSALLRPVELTFPGDEPTAVSSAVSPRAQALADQAAQDVAQLESLSAEALGFAGPLGTPVAPVPVVLGVGVDWIQPGTVDALPVTTSPDRPAPVRRVRATGEPEPVMIGAFDELDGEVVTPDAYFGAIVNDLNGRRAVIHETLIRGRDRVIHASVPLREMFGYVTRLRTLSSGRATAAMTPSCYAPVPAEDARALVG